MAEPSLPPPIDGAETYLAALLAELRALRAELAQTRADSAAPAKPGRRAKP